MKELKSLRRKFVFLNMLIVTVILAAMCAAMLVTTRDNLRTQSIDFLKKSAQDGFSGGWLGQGKRDNINLPSLSVLVGVDGGIVVTSDRFGVAENSALIEKLVTDCMTQPDILGDMKSYGVRYLRTETLLGWRITFVDTAQEQATLRALATQLTLIGLVTLGVFFFISLRLAKWATRPVEESWKRQRQFVSDASHELKTPLTVILSNIDLLERSDPDDPRKPRWLDNLRAASGQMTELVEGLLTLARFDNQAAVAVHQRVDLSELAEEEALLFEPVLFEAGKVLEYSIDEGIFVTGDPSKLRRLMDILLDNARKYADPDSVVTMKLSNEGGKKIRLSVNTKGAVIPPDQLTKLFQRFYRAEQSRTSEGYGLGLSIAMGIVEEHKGKIWAESDEKEGNTFVVVMKAGIRD